MPPRSNLRERGPERGRPRGGAHQLGNLLLLAGMLILLLAGFLYFTDSSYTLPPPVAIAGVSGTASGTTLPADAAATETPTAEPTATAEATVAVFATATTVPTSTPVPTPTPTPVKAGIPIRMLIPSINVDSEVKEAGTYWLNKELYYETLPFVVAHYRMTAKVGEIGNAVFAGHVTSRNAGNVFKDLYKVQLGDKIQIFTEESEFFYEVSSIRLVPPTEVSVMYPTPDATATLITCAGVWNEEKREYSQRLIVAAKLKSAKAITE